MRTWPLLLLVACSGGAPEILPLDETRGLGPDGPDGVTVIRDAESWESFLAAQPDEHALRLRALEIDFARDSFLLARYTATSGATEVRFAPRRVADDEYVIEVGTHTPRGPARADVVVHRWAAVVRTPDLRARMVVDGRPLSDGGGR